MGRWDVCFWSMKMSSRVRSCGTRAHAALYLQVEAYGEHVINQPRLHRYSDRIPALLSATSGFI